MTISVISFSCSKSNNEPAVNNAIVHVHIEPDMTANICGGYGYLVIGVDTCCGFIYHSYFLPPNTVIQNLPDTVNITFHDTTGSCFPLRHIVIDKIYP